MAGGKGGSTTSSVQVPEYIEAAAQRNLNKAERISQLGYVPYYGPDVAAFTPMQQAAMRNVGDAASAFGMSTPTGQDIYGMPTATEYRGGIRGYSSAPMYEQAVAELARQRPAQKSYIDSFFIDPYTGKYGSNVQAPVDYTNYTTAAQQQRDQNAADFAIAQMQAQAKAQPTFTYDGKEYPTSSQASGFISDPASPLITNTSNAGLGTRVWNDLSEAAVGATVGRINPTYKVGAINNPIKTPTIAEMVAAAPSGMTYNPSTGAYVRTGSSSSAPAKVGADAGDGMVWAKSKNSNALVRVAAPKGTTSKQSASSAPKTSPKPVARPSSSSSSSSSSDSSSSSKILCCAYYNLGYLPHDIWRLDQQYGFWVYRNDPELMKGYLMWAKPLADYVQTDALPAKVARAIMWPIVKVWAKEMAHMMKPEKYKPNYVGKVIHVVGANFSRTCAKLKPRKIEELV
jgi:hypothetical protein